MPTIGVIVEGIYDAAAIPVLLKRCRNGVRVVTRSCRGSLIGKFGGIVKELNRSYRIEKVLAVFDADGQDPTTLVRTFKSKLARNYRSAVTPIIVVEMLEAWLIADPLTLESVIGVRKKFISPERIRDPKAELRRLLVQPRAYTPETARRIAEKIDLDVLQQRCPRFSKFLEAVRDP